MANRIQEVLEDAEIKLASVVTDVLGETGRAILMAPVTGEADPAKLAAPARGRLRKKAPWRREALRGSVTEHHRPGRAASRARTGSFRATEGGGEVA